MRDAVARERIVSRSLPNESYVRFGYGNTAFQHRHLRQSASLARILALSLSPARRISRRDASRLEYACDYLEDPALLQRVRARASLITSL